jgi:NADPH:quinone reductase-like Zn-dependent oxidoreductase
LYSHLHFYTTVSPNMRAILIRNGTGPAENLYIGNEATPEPAEGQVQVKVRC